MMLVVVTVLGAAAAWTDFSGLTTASSPPATARSGDGEALTDRGWRRTTRGWEHESAWRPATAAPAPLQQVHPAVVGSLQLLVAVGALLLFETRRG